MVGILVPGNGVAPALDGGDRVHVRMPHRLNKDRINDDCHGSDFSSWVLFLSVDARTTATYLKEARVFKTADHFFFLPIRKVNQRRPNPHPVDSPMCKYRLGGRDQWIL